MVNTAFGSIPSRITPFVQGSILLLQCCFTSTEIIRYRLLGTGSLNRLLLLLLLQICFSSTETVFIGDWEPRTSTSTFTQLLSSEVFSFSSSNVALLSLRPY